MKDKYNNNILKLLGEKNQKIVELSINCINECIPTYILEKDEKLKVLNIVFLRNEDASSILEFLKNNQKNININIYALENVDHIIKNLKLINDITNIYDSKYGINILIVDKTNKICDIIKNIEYIKYDKIDQNNIKILKEYNSFKINLKIKFTKSFLDDKKLHFIIINNKNDNYNEEFKKNKNKNTELLYIPNIMNIDVELFFKEIIFKWQFKELEKTYKLMRTEKIMRNLNESAFI